MIVCDTAASRCSATYLQGKSAKNEHMMTGRPTTARTIFLAADRPSRLATGYARLPARYDSLEWTTGKSLSIYLPYLPQLEHVATLTFC